MKPIISFVGGSDYIGWIYMVGCFWLIYIYYFRYRGWNIGLLYSDILRWNTFDWSTNTISHPEVKILWKWKIRCMHENWKENKLKKSKDLEEETKIPMLLPLLYSRAAASSTKAETHAPRMRSLVA